MAMAVNNVTRPFQSFMARVIALEDMAKLSSQMLAVFQQELVLAKEPSERLNVYRDAGYRHCHTDHAVLIKYNALKFLQNHVQRARAIIEEIQKLLEDANESMHDTLNAQLRNFALVEDDVGVSETAQTGQGVHLGEDSSLNIKRRHLTTPDYVTTMAAIYDMLQQDFSMQEKVVATLGLDLSSELLQNYQTMWTLRPFLNETVVEEALSCFELLYNLSMAEA